MNQNMATAATIAPSPATLPPELSDNEINGVRLEKAVDLGTKVFRDEFHKTFPRNPADLYTELQKKRFEINRYTYIITPLLIFRVFSSVTEHSWCNIFCKSVLESFI